jgi:hypothetical protein
MPRHGLIRRFAPRNDDTVQTGADQKICAGFLLP